MPLTRSRLLLILFVFNSLLTQAQSDRNDPDPTRWINYAQTYYKIPIAQNGLYRITTTDFQQAGIPITQIDPTTVQLFHRGVEQAVYLEGEIDHQFDSTDFLEFYGRGNDGAQDSLLYKPHTAQPHTYYSLFNDTTAYFLTWRLDGKAGKRMKTYTDTAYANLTPETYHWAEEVRLFTDTYPGWAAGIPPKIEYSYYEVGEGYTGLVQQKDKPYANVFQLTDPVTIGPKPQVDVLLVGREFTNHRVECLAGPTTSSQRLLDTVRFSDYDNAHIRQDANWQDIGKDNKLVISTISRGDSTTPDPYSVSYIRLRYPQKITNDGQPMRQFRLLPNALDRSLVDVADVLPNTRFWDISDSNAPIRIGITTPTAKSARLVVQGTDTARCILSASQFKIVPGIHPIAFTDWTSRKPTYLIISHADLMKPAHGTTNAVRGYATYRASAVGGSYDTLTVSMQQLIDQYSYGERNPLAIRRFARQMRQQGKGSLQYLLLIGRGRSTPGIRRDSNQATLDRVMTGGFPGSDIVFTEGLDDNEPNVPAIPTGRINAETPQEVINYLNKVKEYERPTADLSWRKTLLHLSGGETPYEASLFRHLLDSYRDQAIQPFLGARVTTISKETDTLVEQVNVAKPVNAGVGLLTFFGHSGLDVTDLDIGFCSNDALGYANKGKYPLLLINGCAIGNFFYGRPTLTTDWVLAPDRGAIAAIAQSHLGYTDVLDQYSLTFYALLTDSTQLYKSIGQLQQETIRRVLRQSPDGRALANCQQMVLQGDPAIHVFPFKTPDYVLTAGGLSVQASNQQPLTTLSDSIQIRAIVQNIGQYWSGQLPVRVRRSVNGQKSAVFNTSLPHAIANLDTLTLTFPNEGNSEGQNQFEVTINPIDSPATRRETNHDNNVATVDVTLAGQKPVLIYPAPGSVIKTTTVRLMALYLGNGLHTFDLDLDSTSHFDSPFRVSQRITATNTISYPTTLPDLSNKIYYWRVRLADKANDPDSWSTGTFIYAPNNTVTGLPEGQIRLATPLPTDSQQGDIVNLPIEFTNLSPYPFLDSLVVQQTIYSAGLVNPQTTRWHVKAPTGSDTLRFTTRIATEKWPGINRLVLTVNPRVQPEYSFLNNTLDLLIPVQPDTFAPLLEVAFDGARITDGSTVSAKPLIDIVVADENRTLIRRDTAGLNLYLQRPGKNTIFERLSWRTAKIQPVGADNVFRLRYPSAMLPEGSYQLLVTARDAVGNEAVPYKVSFRVLNERKLTDLTVYPNPFRDNVLFSFQLTGNQAPSTLTLTLTDLSGHVVHQLHQSGRIGLNEWQWNGRTEGGDALPAGIYIYKLTLSDADGTAWPVANSLRGELNGRILLIR
ncbi:putative type IX secretion system sortase PorU2 [Spirosoma endophyticum]|uniref:Por secretion system C-terminal sorting domain-containing protein n=1 Tax=Spirosoma endophyticum TaxID=662367 RepID=A0A1I2CT23_9BACT|nr:C25 family cysteine peptidase [Spirosoma endophyticum]SFE71408.1 Por secretion system C-terminal sorting domain-containing protein [Spirosoma endophyticum]